MKRILLIICVLLLAPKVAFARSKTSCDYTLLANLKKLASNINVTYTYYIKDNEAYFDVTLTNLQENIYFTDNFNRTYYYNNTLGGVITIPGYRSGKVTFTFYSNDSECLNEKLSVKYANLPYYNSFYNYEECKGIEEFSLCQKWSKSNYGYDEFRERTNKYKQSKNNSEVNNNEIISKNWFEKIVDLYLSYYYIITPLFILAVLGIMYSIKYIKYRLNRFNI